MSIDHLSQEEIKAEQARFMTKVYGWMSGALILTGLIAAWVANTEAIISVIFSNRLYFYGLLIAEFACVAYLSAVIGKIRANTAITLFLGYAVLNGLTFSVIFLAFTAASIATTFYITAGTFGVMSMYGYYTKTDLTSVGNIAFMGLIGIIIASVVNFFFQNEMLYWIVTYAGVLIFVALTAYDTQKIKQLNIIGNEGTEEDTKEAVMGALTLYLDFINLFLFLLRLFGRRK
ncbi:Bax inhibitor-1/YccA family protein [Galbibacter pacificus]|uniref:Bax inhibitor-1/YccA family protein n=1 Tax=Galbibacter pacificus TaxID=2996052 RepID=A0ABT6FU44_9FLAO|nr:Bax inhibitor-1/YccA family protein [Galbibacter pacificus]MDG3583161.1 Bax inhibitor-1/YccA family protein [Galbibacter pacificus]MDG3586642.1 Bax inhibitor-1/YccA family protein [Galbibacter pacificus]